MKQTQYGWIFFAIIIPINLVAYYTKQPFSELSILALLSAMILLLFYKLTISITDDTVRFSMGIGIIGGNYKLENIIHCKLINNIPMGYGIRLISGATLYNVAGRKAIELVIKGKKRNVWIGSNLALELCEYINKKREGLHSNTHQ